MTLQLIFLIIIVIATFFTLLLAWLFDIILGIEKNKKDQNSYSNVSKFEEDK